MGSGISEPSVPLTLQTESAPGASEFAGDVVKFSSVAPGMNANLPLSGALADIAPVPESGQLGDFLRRPVVIEQFSWTAATTSFHIDPWVNWLSDLSVVPKLQGYRYVRGNLHLSIQFNGTPFHSGRMMVSYEPCNWNRVTGDGDARAHSGNQHILLDPSANNVATFVCPFVSPYNWIDRTGDSSAVRNSSTTTISSGFTAALGVLNFDVIALLRIFQGGTPSPVEVTVYAWLDNAELAMPTTATNVAFVAQAGDEYSVQPHAGLVSRPAAALSAFASRFSSTPYVAPFATATSIAANAVSSIASLFGYSRPRDLTPPVPMVQHIVGNMVNVDASDGSTSLTFNTKSETAVGPGITGFDPGCDELAIQSIAGRWGYGGVIQWNNTQAPGTTLFSAGVGPNLLSTLSGGHFRFTHLGFASSIFDHWHGTIDLRIVIAASRFHRGRLRISWSPMATTLTDINLAYNHVIDISGSREYCIHLPYVAMEGYKEVGSPPAAITSTFNKVQHSGLLTISVQNTLVAQSAENLDILLFVRAGSDFKLASPNYNYTSKTIYDPTAGPPAALLADEGEEGVEEEFVPQSGSVTELGMAAAVDCEDIVFIKSHELPKYDVAYFGDPILSFRSMLKRYTFVTTLSAFGTMLNAEWVRYDLTWSLFPTVARRVTSGLWLVVTPVITVDRTNLHLSSYLGFAFLGKRGSFRSIVDANIDRTHIATETNFQVSRRVLGSRAYDVVRTPASYPTVSGANAVGLYMALDYSPFGAQIFPSTDHTVRAHVETPFYSPLKYQSAVDVGTLMPTIGGAVEPESPQRFTGTRLTWMLRHPTVSSTPSQSDFSIYQAAGEDFNLFFYRGPPVMEVNTNQALVLSTNYV